MPSGAGADDHIGTQQAPLYLQRLLEKIEQNQKPS